MRRDIIFYLIYKKLGVFFGIPKLNLNTQILNTIEQDKVKNEIITKFAFVSTKIFFFKTKFLR